MAVDISAEVSRNWPKTEAKLIGDADVDYLEQKSLAIDRAKIDIYETRAAVPDDESNIPDRVAVWIADRATIYLISLAKEFYAVERRRSTSKEGATVTHYDLLAMLDGLKLELEQACALAKEDVKELAGAWAAAHDVPAVSTDGMLIDPVIRATERGQW